MRGMHKVLGLMIVLGLAAASPAYVVSLDPAADNYATPSGSGTVDVLVDTAPENYTFANGTLGVSVASSNPGVIAITGATVYNPSLGFVDRWAAATTAGIAADGIDELLGTSVNTPALDPNAPKDGPNGTYLFATIEYDVIGEGTTDLTLAPISRASGGVFLVSEGTDVTADADFAGSTITVVPEPATLSLMALAGLAAIRRRR